MWKSVQPEGEAQATLKADGVQSYMLAIDNFRNAATEFLQHVHLLSKARNAYDQAMTSSAELREFLDLGDESLRGLMTQLEQSVNNHLSQAVTERKKPALVKADTSTFGTPDKSLDTNKERGA